MGLVLEGGWGGRPGKDSSSLDLLHRENLGMAQCKLVDVVRRGVSRLAAEFDAELGVVDRVERRADRPVDQSKRQPFGEEARLEKHVAELHQQIPVPVAFAAEFERAVDEQRPLQVRQSSVMDDPSLAGFLDGDVEWPDLDPWGDGLDHYRGIVADEKAHVRDASVGESFDCTGNPVGSVDRENVGDQVMEIYH